MRVECNTQAECDTALKDGDLPVLVGAGYFSINGTAHVVAWGSSHVEAWESSHVEAWGSSHVVAWGSSHVVARGSSHVEARGSSHVEARESSHVVAWGSSHVEAWESSHVEARESSHVVARESSHVEARGSSHVEAWGSSHVEARGSSHVVASKLVAIHQHSTASQITGGVVIAVQAPKNPIEWCEYYGAKNDGKIATLFKAVRDDYRSAHNFLYQPGTTPEAPDWDGGVKECGGGLHFCAGPGAALGFASGATRFVACPVALEDIAVHANPSYPNKIKARRIIAPIYEVDRYGKPLAVQK